MSVYFEPLAMHVAAGRKTNAAAKVVGISRTQAYRIASTSEFKKRVNEIRGEITSQALGKLCNAATKAVDTLLELLDASHEPSTRLNASKAILGALAPMTDLAELRGRIDAIETKASAPKSGKVAA